MFTESPPELGVIGSIESSYKETRNFTSWFRFLIEKLNILPLEKNASPGRRLGGKSQECLEEYLNWK